MTDAGCVLVAVLVVVVVLSLAASPVHRPDDRRVPGGRPNPETSPSPGPPPFRGSTTRLRSSPTRTPSPPYSTTTPTSPGRSPNRPSPRATTRGGSRPVLARRRSRRPSPQTYVQLYGVGTRRDGAAPNINAMIQLDPTGEPALQRPHDAAEHDPAGGPTRSSIGSIRTTPARANGAESAYYLSLPQSYSPK